MSSSKKTAGFVRLADHQAQPDQGGPGGADLQLQLARRLASESASECACLLELLHQIIGGNIEDASVAAHAACRMVAKIGAACDAIGGGQVKGGAHRWLFEDDRDLADALEAFERRNEADREARQ